MKRVVLLATAVAGTGGIQRFNRLLARALAELCQDAGAAAELLVLMDRDRDREVDVDGDRPGAPANTSRVMSTRVFGGDRGRFAGAAVALAARADVVLLGHANFLPLALPVQAAARVRRRPRVAVVLHGIEAWDRWPWPSRRAARRIDRLVAVSRYTAGRCAAANDLGHVPVAVLPDALDPAFEVGLHEVAAGRAEPAGCPRLLTVSRLGPGDEYKGVDLVIRALPAVLARHPEARYDVVGDGALVAGLRALAEKLGVAERVAFRGWLSEAELARAYQECTVFVLPSAKEGFGLTHIEAMAFGRPVVAARAGATPEVVCDGTTGLLVPPGDVPAIAGALGRLLDDGAARRRLGAAGRDHVRASFTYQRLAERTRALVPALW